MTTHDASMSNCRVWWIACRRGNAAVSEGQCAARHPELQWQMIYQSHGGTFPSSAWRLHEIRRLQMSLHVEHKSNTFHTSRNEKGHLRKKNKYLEHSQQHVQKTSDKRLKKVSTSVTNWYKVCTLGPLEGQDWDWRKSGLKDLESGLKYLKPGLEKTMISKAHIKTFQTLRKTRYFNPQFHGLCWSKQRSGCGRWWCLSVI